MRLFYAVFTLICLGAGSQRALAQCLTYRDDIHAVSDRYTTAAHHRQHLILANEFGLVVKDLNDLKAPPLLTMPVAGKITQMQKEGNRLFLVAEGEGVHEYLLEQDPNSSNILEYVNWHEVPGLRSAAVNGNYLFTVDGKKVQMARFNGESGLKSLASFPATGTRLLASSNTVFLHRENRRILLLPYQSDGFGESPGDLNLLGEAIFYNATLHNGRLILDAPSGVKWARFSDSATISEQGFLYRNKNQELILSSAVSGIYLYLRFNDRLEIRPLSFTGTPQVLSSIPMDFTEFLYTKIHPVEEYLHIFNVGTSDRQWSLTSYLVSGNRPLLLARLAPQFSQFQGAAMIDGSVYLADGRGIFQLEEKEEADPELVQAAVLNDPIQSIIGSPKRILAVTTTPVRAFTKITQLRPSESGLNASLQNEYRGTLSQFSQYEETFSFLQYFQRTDGDHYVINVLQFGENANAVNRTVSSVFPLQTTQPFVDVQISSLGLSYHDGRRISLHPNLENLEEKWVLDLETAQDIQRLTMHQGHFWVESGEHLAIYNLTEGSLNQVGLYTHWHDLQRLNGNLLIARSYQDKQASRFHVISMEPEGFVSANLSFTTSAKPIMVRQSEQGIAISEQSALHNFQIRCPQPHLNYLVPFAPGLEMELNTLNLDNDLILVTIYNEQNQIIGTQSMTPAQLAALNRSQVEDWLFDYNHLETPFSFLLSASKPLAPVISGATENAEMARFAYQISPVHNSQVFVPHVPRNLEAWDTNIYLRNFSPTAAEYSLENATGESASARASAGGTDIIDLKSLLPSQNTPWARFVSHDLNTSLAGFSLYQENSDLKTAAVPLVAELSEFMIVPHLAGQTRPGWWTGLVLANVFDKPITFRAVGYGKDGSTLLDVYQKIDASSSMVVIAESWLEGLRKADQVQWLALSVEKQIMGMVLYGSGDPFNLSGLPLNSQFSDRLIYPGIRSNEDWWTQLIVTNLDTAQSAVTFEAADGQGRIFLTTKRLLQSKGLLQVRIEDLFPAITPQDRARIRTVRASSESQVSGFVFRGIRGTTSLESYRACMDP